MVERRSSGAGEKVPDPEVVARPRRRQFTAEYKMRILREADACKEPGEIGALLRREGLYSSHLVQWRRQREQAAQIYRVGRAAGALPPLEPVIDLAAPALPPGYSRAAADRLAAQTLSGTGEPRSIEALGSSGDLLHAAAVIRSKDGQIAGVVVATDYLTGDLATRSRRMTEAFENYNQLRVLRRPPTGVYLSFFLMVTLMILVGAIWMGLYLTKRITRPVLELAAAAREIGAGRLDQRVEPQSNDEFGTLVDAFNTMASELATSRRKVDRSTLELERKHVEVEGRRRYIETILERVATGVVSIDDTGDDCHAISSAFCTSGIFS